MMERETGIEPATSSLGSWRSTAELLPLKHSVSAYYHRSCASKPHSLFISEPTAEGPVTLLYRHHPPQQAALRIDPLRVHVRVMQRHVDM
jgi:hypothetical protein